MKKLFFLILITFVYVINNKINAQTKEKTLSQAEQFSAQSGTLIEKQFFDIGKVGGIQIQVIKYKDLNTGISRSALRFEYEYKSSYSSDIKVAILDMDEIDGLIKSMTNLEANVFPSTRENYTEVTFRSRTGFEAGAYFSVAKSKWTAFFQLEKFDKNSNVFLSTDDFAEILKLIQLSKTKMQ